MTMIKKLLIVSSSEITSSINLTSTKLLDLNQTLSASLFSKKITSKTIHTSNHKIFSSSNLETQPKLSILPISTEEKISPQPKAGNVQISKIKSSDLSLIPKFEQKVTNSVLTDSLPFYGEKFLKIKSYQNNLENRLISYKFSSMPIIFSIISSPETLPSAANAAQLKTELKIKNLEEEYVKKILLL